MPTRRPSGRTRPHGARLRRDRSTVPHRAAANLCASGGLGDGPGIGSRIRAVTEQQDRGRAIVAGVLPGNPLWIVQVAGEYARTFGAELVCVHVDPARYAFQDLPDGSLMTAPIDPDLLDVGPAFDEERLRALGGLLDPTGVRWSVREAVGDAADALIAVADEVDALMLVVGASRGGLRGAVRAALSGTVGVRLAHRQYRPVVVVPTAPEPDARDDEAPQDA